MEAEIKWSKPIKSYYGVSQYQTLHGIFCNDTRPETESYIGFTSLNNNGSSDRWGDVQERLRNYYSCVHLPEFWLRIALILLDTQ